MTAPALPTVVVLTSRAQLKVPEEKAAGAGTLLTAAVRTNRARLGDLTARDVTAPPSVSAAVLTGSPWPRQYQSYEIIRKRSLGFLSYDLCLSINLNIYGLSQIY